MLNVQARRVIFWMTIVAVVVAIVTAVLAVVVLIAMGVSSGLGGAGLDDGNPHGVPIQIQPPGITLLVPKGWFGRFESYDGQNQGSLLLRRKDPQSALIRFEYFRSPLPVSVDRWIEEQLRSLSVLRGWVVRTTGRLGRQPARELRVKIALNRPPGVGYSIQRFAVINGVHCIKLSITGTGAGPTRAELRAYNQIAESFRWVGP